MIRPIIFFFCFLILQGWKGECVNTGPTEPTTFLFNSTLSIMVKGGIPIPFQITKRLPTGLTDTAFTKIVDLRAYKGVPSVLFEKNFDTSSGTDGWLGSRASSLTYTTSAALGTAQAAQVPGGLSTPGHPITTSNDLYQSLGGNHQPARLSCFLRTNDLRRTGPYIMLAEEASTNNWRMGLNVAIFGDPDNNPSLTGIRFRNGQSTDPVWSPLTPNGFTPIANNVWYKVDVTYDWTNKEETLWVNDVRYNTFVFNAGGTSQVNSVGRIYMYNWESTTVSFVDELKVVLNEVTLTEISLSPLSISFQNGVWQGTITPTQTETDIYFQAEDRASGLSILGKSHHLNVEYCNLGQFSPNYYTCQDCGVGTYSDTTGLSYCLDCSAGTYSDTTGLSQCLNCAVGTFSNTTGSTQCSQCQLGTSTNGTTGSTSCVICWAGTYSNLESCISCGPGRYSSAQSSSCDDCPPGTFSELQQAATCQLCPRGHYNSEPTQSSCLPCQAGSSSEQGSISPSNCTLCPSGTFSGQPGQDCTVCIPGTFTNQPGQTSCDLCPSGTFSTAGVCIECPPGQYNGLSGQAACSNCPLGTFSSATGATSISTCEPCPPGNSSPVGSGICIPCPIGSYKDQAGGPCLECPFGQTTVTEGSTECQTTCGNSVIDQGETCDDGNLVDGDGCSSTCQIEPGWTCSQPGNPCSRISAQNKEDNLMIIAGATGSGVLVLLCFVLLLLLLRKKRKQKRTDLMVTELQASQQSIYDYLPKTSSVSALPYHLQEEEIQRNKKKSIDLNASITSSMRENMKRNTILNSDLIRGSIIGKGAFGMVMKGTWRGTEVAIKEIAPDALNEKEVGHFLEEAEVMRNMQRHPNVVLFLGICLDPFSIVTEFLENGDLKTFLKNHQISVETQISIIRDISAGMFHLSMQGIVHRDLAARNVLLSKDMVAKVSDFGLARLSDSSSVVYSKSDVGPLKWMAPEAIRKKKFSEKTDVWAFGVTCTEILSRGEDPYPGMDAVQVATAVVTEKLTPTFPDVHSRLSDILYYCFVFEPEGRPTFGQLHSTLTALLNS